MQQKPNAQEIDEPVFLTIQETSSLLHCHPNTLRMWDKSGLLKAVRIGNRGDRRYKKKDIMKIVYGESKNIESKSTNSLQIIPEEVLERMSDAFIAFDSNWKYIYANKNAQELLQITKDDLLGKEILELFPQAKDMPIYTSMEKAKAENKVKRVEFQLDNSRRWIEAKIYPSATGVSMFLLDNTEKHKEKERKDFIMKLSMAMTSSLDYESTLSNISKLIVPGFADWFSVQVADKKKGLSTIEISHIDPKKVQWAYKLSRNSKVNMNVKQGAPYVFKTGKSELYPHITDDMLQKSAKDKEELHLLRQVGFQSVMIVPLCATGKTIGVVTFVYTRKGNNYNEEDLQLAEEVGRIAGVAIDNATLYSDLQKELVERKKIENSLRESERRLEAYLENSLEAVQVVDKEGRVIYSSISAEKLSGHKRETLLGKVVFPYIYKDDRQEVKRLFNELVKTPGGSITTEYRIQRRDGKWIWVETIGTNMLHNPSINGIVANFRDITERKAIEKKLREQAELVEHAHDAIMMLDQKSNILFWNPEAEKLYGWKEEDVLGKTSSKLLNTVFPIPKEAVRETLLAKGVWQGELLHKTKNGETLIVESRWALVRDTNDTYRILEINRDISERREIENRKDEFISIASHELKTPLTSMLVFAQYLKKYANEDKNKTLDLYLQKIVNQVGGLSKLVSDLLDITKIQAGKLPLHKEPFDLYSSIQEKIEIARAVYTHKINLEGTLPMVYGDKERLNQVFDNLLSNAIKYSPKAHKVAVMLSQEGRFAKVCVRDWGIGIEKEYQSKVFERFFRAEAPQERTFPGLGIGLYVSMSIIQRHGGKIWVESEKGKGSLFCFTVPIA